MWFLLDMIEELKQVLMDNKPKTDTLEYHATDRIHITLIKYLRQSVTKYQLDNFHCANDAFKTMF